MCRPRLDGGRKTAVQRAARYGTHYAGGPGLNDGGADDDDDGRTAKLRQSALKSQLRAPGCR